EVEFSFRNTAEPAASIARLPLARQKYLLDWSRRVASANTELGFQYSCHAVAALSSMQPEMVEAWALHAMDIYDREGLRPALAVIQQLTDFVKENRERTLGTVLADTENVLHGFLNGLSGRKLRLAESEQAYTDTGTIYLPPVEARLASRTDNFLLYKSTIAILWSQIRYGTFRAPLLQEMERQENPDRFLQLFHALENLRLEGIISRELPG
ncbi:MAG: nitric oxide reductase activation protein, partial [Gammaproteobacteria bacterium]|nr:nitric oxide reductase activation protein [Gammaproteobacteria bacterium]